MHINDILVQMGGPQPMTQDLRGRAARVASITRGVRT